MNCEKCGTPLGIDDRFCPNCGSEQKVESNGTFCRNCGTEIFEGDTFCPGCGASVKTPGPTAYYAPDASYEKPKSKNTAMVVLIIVLAALLAAAVGIAAYFIYTNNSQEEKYTDNYVANVEKSTPTPMPAPPKFDYVTASSTRGYDKDSSTGAIVNYYPEYAVDGDMTTAWTPNRNIDSVPSITLNANEKQYVTGIRMTNGYCKSEKTYTRNRRITRVRIDYDGGQVEKTFGIDNYRTMFSIPFPEPVYTDYITITVLETHYGDWKDIAISEIQVY